MLTNEVSVAPNGGRGFGPRHLDFHPSKPWMYVSVETQNEMYMYGMENGRINPKIAYRAGTLAEPSNIRARQAAGTVHVHPNGRFLYGANRAEATTEFQRKQVFKGGENSIVVYAIDQSTGEHTPIQHIATQKIHPRTFHIDPSGRLLVAQHNLPVNVRDGEAVKEIPAGLSVFRIGDDGKLTFVRTYDIDVGNKTMFWMGMVPLQASALQHVWQYVYPRISPRARVKLRTEQRLSRRAAHPGYLVTARAARARSSSPHEPAGCAKGAPPMATCGCVLELARPAGQKRDEPHRNQIFPFNAGRRLLEPDEVLRAAVRPKRQQHDPDIPKLRDQIVRNAFGRRRHHDAVVRSFVGSAFKSVPDPRLDVVIAKRRQSRASGLCKRAVTLNRDHFAREARKNGCLVT